LQKHNLTVLDFAKASMRDTIHRLPVLCHVRPEARLMGIIWCRALGEPDTVLIPSRVGQGVVAMVRSRPCWTNALGLGASWNRGRLWYGRHRAQSASSVRHRSCETAFQQGHWVISPRRPWRCQSLTLPSCPGDVGRICAQVLHRLADALLHPVTSPAAQPEQPRAILHAISEVRPPSYCHVYGYTPWFVSLDGGCSQRVPLLCPVTTMLRCVTSGRALNPVDVRGGGRMHEARSFTFVALMR